MDIFGCIYTMYLQVMKIYIYGLYEDDEEQLRYIGASKEPDVRLTVHASDLDSTTAKGKWVKELREKGKRPKMRILEETDENHVREREEYWINKYYVPSPIFNRPKSGYGCVKEEAFDKTITIRVNGEWLGRLKEIAQEKGMSYQALMKMWITDRMW